tara:strand:+ start:1342 stop:1773 length:432 start_codon:yes stop_codon:yes gene_type:complete
MIKKMTILMLLGLIIACSSNDDKNEANDDKNESMAPGGGLEGKWEMTSYTAYMPSLPEISENGIEWTFNAETQELKVINNLESEYPYIMKSGVYDLKILNDKIIFVAEKDTMNYKIIDNNLSIDTNTDPRISRDGPIMEFKWD